MTEENTEYNNILPKNVEEEKNQIIKNINKMSAKAYHNWFNSQFESQMATKKNDNVNQWFSSDDRIFETKERIAANTLGEEMERMRKKNSELVRYNGVHELKYNTGSSLYDDDETNKDGDYIASDPFGKLKFDDLRKVHKDQTIMAVSEADITKIRTYKSIDELSRMRNSDNLDPIHDEEARRILKENERIMKESILKKQFEANKKTDEYEEKNKSIVSKFLRLAF